MKKISFLLFTICVITLTCFVSFTQFISPSYKEKILPLDEFSTGKAVGYLENIAVVPHPMGSLENNKVREYIVEQFESMGMEVAIQEKDVEQIKNRIYPESKQTGSVHNIIAKLPGTASPENIIIFTGHYDSTPNGPGAGDGGYGVATILEAGRAFSNLEKPYNTIYFLITDGEEQGLLGASAFSELEDVMDRVKLFVNFESRGNRGVPILFETNTNNLELIKTLRNTVQFPVAYSFAYDVYNLLNNDTDYSVYKRAGKQGYNFANINGNDTYHRMSDNLENIDRNTMEHFGSYAFPLLKKYAYMDNESLDTIENSKGNAVYFPLFYKNLIIYPESFVMPLLCITIALGIFVFAVGFRNNIFQLDKTLKCIGLTLKMFVGSGAILYALSRLIASITYIFDMPLSDLFAILILIISLVLCILFVKRLSSEHNTSNVIFSVLFIWIVFTILSGFFMKGISYAFSIPSIVFLVILIPVVFQHNMIKSPIYRYLSILLCNVPGTILLAPIMYIVYVSMSIDVTPVFVILVSLIVMPSFVAINGCKGMVE